MRLVPAPFLCATWLLLSILEGDRLDRQLAETAAMTLRLFERALGLVGEYLDLLAEQVLADLGLDLGVLGGVAVERTAVRAHGQGVVGDALAFLGVDAIDDDRVAGAHLELLSTDADHRVSDVGLRHFNSPQDNGR